MSGDARRGGQAALAALALVAGLPPAPTTAGASPAELVFVHVEANVGGASGGHVALRVDDAVFHVQQHGAGLFRLRRDDWEHFRHLYGDLQNRPLHLATVAVDEADRDRVLDALARFRVVGEDDLARHAELAVDVAWLEALAAAHAPPSLAGAGLLAAGGAADPNAAALRARVVAARGEAFLPAALEEAGLEIAARAARPDPEGLREALLWREALLGLAEARPVARDAVLPDAGLAPLAEDEREGVRRLAARLEASALRLLVSRRPDRGRALLLAEARHQLALRSLEGGRLVLLDPVPDDAPRVTGSELLRSESYAAEAAELAQVLAEGRPLLLAPDAADEPRLSLLEESAARLVELRHGAAGEPPRVMRRGTAPARGRVLPLPAERPAGGRLEAALGEARRSLARHEALLRERYGYDVIRRNCTTELVRILNGAFPTPGDARRALGGLVEPADGAGFIPFVFFGQVRDRLRVTRLETLPSYRRRELARLLAAPGGPWLRLRERGALTATLYAPRRRDGHFLFFSDDVLWPRPLLGAANLGYALARGALGLAAAPFDAGGSALAAANGAFFSVPELVFQNVRKGSYEYVAPDPSER